MTNESCEKDHITPSIRPLTFVKEKKAKTLFQSTIFYFLVYSAYVTFFRFLLISMI
jgi:hypothetical protein